MQCPCATLVDVLCPLYDIFLLYLINGTIFGKNKNSWIQNCVFWFSLQVLSETFLILRRIQRDMIINVYRSSCKVPLFLSDFSETWIFVTYFRKILRHQFSWESIQWESSYSIRTDGQTDRHDETFRNLTNAPKKCDFWLPPRSTWKMRALSLWAIPRQPNG